MRPMAANADLRPFQRSARVASSAATRSSKQPQATQIRSTSAASSSTCCGDAVELDEQDRTGSGRVARGHRGLGGLDRQPVHHLDRRRQDPGGHDPRDRCAGRIRRLEAREQRAHGLGHADDPERHLGDDAERPLGSDDDAEEVHAVGVERLAAELDDVAVRQHERRTRDVVHGEAVLEAVRAAGVLGDVAADRADLLARRVGRVEVAVRRDRTRDVEVRDAGLDDDATALEVDLEDAVHAGERDDDAARDRSGAAREPGAGAARDERDTRRVTRANDRLHLFGRPGQRDELGDRSVPGQPVALVHAELLELRDDVLVSERTAQLLDEGRVDPHACQLYGAQNSSNAAGSLGSASTSRTSPSSMRKSRSWSSSSVRPWRLPRAR